MMLAIAIQAVIVALLAGVDAVRIRLIWGKKPNINHYVSYGLAVAAGIAQWFFIPPHWHPVLFGILCLSMRELLYDPLLNIFRRERWDYTSTATNSLTDQVEQRWRIPFWVQRALAAAVLVITIIIQSLL